MDYVGVGLQCRAHVPTRVEACCQIGDTDIDRAGTIDMDGTASRHAHSRESHVLPRVGLPASLDDMRPSLQNRLEGVDLSPRPPTDTEMNHDGTTTTRPEAVDTTRGEPGASDSCTAIDNASTRSTAAPSTLT